MRRLILLLVTNLVVGVPQGRGRSYMERTETGGQKGYAQPQLPPTQPPQKGYARPQPPQKGYAQPQPPPTTTQAFQKGYARPRPTQPPQKGYAQPQPPPTTTQPPQKGYARPQPTQPSQKGYARPQPTTTTAQPPCGQGYIISALTTQPAKGYQPPACPPPATTTTTQAPQPCGRSSQSSPKGYLPPCNPPPAPTTTTAPPPCGRQSSSSSKGYQAPCNPPPTTPAPPPCGRQSQSSSKGYQPPCPPPTTTRSPCASRMIAAITTARPGGDKSSKGYQPPACPPPQTTTTEAPCRGLVQSPPPGVKGYAPPACPPPPPTTTTVPPCQQATTPATKGYQPPVHSRSRYSASDDGRLKLYQGLQSSSSYNSGPRSYESSYNAPIRRSQLVNFQSDQPSEFRRQNRFHEPSRRILGSTLLRNLETRRGNPGQFSHQQLQQHQNTYFEQHQQQPQEFFLPTVHRYSNEDNLDDHGPEEVNLSDTYNGPVLG